MVGPAGFEPTPTWLRAKHATINTTDPKGKL